MLKNLVVFICIILFTTTSNATPALVVDVVDGDTIKVFAADKLTTVRFYGVDCPEKKQARGMEAKTFIESMLEGKTVDVNSINTDRYGRTVAVVMHGNQCVQEQLLVSGLAWVYPQYCRKEFCPAWMSLQRIAATNKYGLWNDPMPVQPWVWRNKNEWLVRI